MMTSLRGPKGLLRSAALSVLVGVLVGSLSCTNTKVVRLPVEANLGEPDDPVPTSVSGVRVAFKRPALVNDPDRRVDFTNSFAESYPSMSHLAVAVPQALREIGFDVVEVADAKDTEAIGAEYFLDLQMPQVAAFHPATGDRVTLVGSVYDIRVKYRGSLATADLRPMGVVSGFGQSTARFVFMEPLFREAVIGAFVAAGTLLASVFMLSVMFRFGFISSLAGGGDPFGYCTEDTAKQFEGIPRPPTLGPTTPLQVCVEVANYVLSSAFVAATGLFTGFASSMAGNLGETVFNVGLAFAFTLGVDPIWRGMVKAAHDRAARDFASQMAARVSAPSFSAPRREPPPPPPAPEPPPAPAPLLPPDEPTPVPQPLIPQEEPPSSSSPTGG
ncbi:MAG: hypothetical protein AB2A00_05845 [Myxococcota bacterium]